MSADTDGMRKLIEELNLPHNSQKEHQLITFHAVLKKWNARISLTGSTDWSALSALFREGLWASGYYSERFKNHLDIGSGAGFPAIILKIMHPGVRLDLVESRTKKVVFLETIIDELGLTCTQAHCMRLEDYLRENEGIKWDCISWKAIKLKKADIRQLTRHTHTETALWMFHGKEAAVEDAEDFFKNFRSVASEEMKWTNESRLTVCRPIRR
jgi:16S rRNA (guanine(527)-N(7))-methyltransferase RsmG